MEPAAIHEIRATSQPARRRALIFIGSSELCIGVPLRFLDFGTEKTLVLLILIGSCRSLFLFSFCPFAPLV